jgi:hypothetical protein
MIMQETMWYVDVNHSSMSCAIMGRFIVRFMEVDEWSAARGDRHCEGKQKCYTGAHRQILGDSRRPSTTYEARVATAMSSGWLLLSHFTTLRQRRLPEAEHPAAKQCKMHVPSLGL